MIGTISNTSGKRSNLSDNCIVKIIKLRLELLNLYRYIFVSVEYIIAQTSINCNEFVLLFSLLRARELVFLINILLRRGKVGENIAFFRFDLPSPSVPVHSGLTLSDSLSVFIKWNDFYSHKSFALLHCNYPIFLKSLWSGCLNKSNFWI